MEITNATLFDLDSIYALNSSLLADGESWEKSMLEKDFPLSKYLVAKIDGKVVGYLSYRVVLDECEIFQICVDESFQRQGIASKLFESLLESENVEKIFLEVSSLNDKAIAFYTSKGFTIIREIENYYGNHSAFNMVKVQQK